MGSLVIVMVEPLIQIGRFELLIRTAWVVVSEESGLVGHLYREVVENEKIKNCPTCQHLFDSYHALANALAGLGYELHLITQHSGGDVLSAKVNVHHLPFKGNMGDFLNAPFLRKYLK